MTSTRDYWEKGKIAKAENGKNAPPQAEDCSPCCSPLDFSASAYEPALWQAAEAIAGADRLLVGVGSGLTASAGLDYSSEDLVREWYPHYYEQGLTSIEEIQNRLFSLNSVPAVEFWAFWAEHLYRIRHRTPLLEPYRLLADILAGRDYFIVTGNVDGQLGKAGLNPDRIYAPQGEYAYFQCSRRCTDDLFPNLAMLENMLDHKPDPLHIRPRDIPICPNCGAYQAPNLRVDNTFVSRPHMRNHPAYAEYVQMSLEQNLVLLEIGVGYSTPDLIRFPFEDLARLSSKAMLIRINQFEADLPADLTENALLLEQDASLALRNIQKLLTKAHWY